MRNGSREQRFTIIDDGQSVEVTAVVDGGGVRLPARTLPDALGWELKPEGLCRGDTCVPLSRQVSIDTDGIDIADLAAALHRPLAFDVAEAAAYLGASAQERGAALAMLVAPDFSLPDLVGRLHALSDQRGKKVLLVIYASW